MSHMRSIEVTTFQIFNGRTGDIKDLCHLILKGTLPESWKNLFYFLVQSESWDVWKPSFKTIKAPSIWIPPSISPLLSNFLTNLTLTVQHFENLFEPENQKFPIFSDPNFFLNLKNYLIVALPLRFKKRGDLRNSFVLLGVTPLTRGSLSLSCTTTPHPSCFSES